MTFESLMSKKQSDYLVTALLTVLVVQTDISNDSK